MQIWPRTTTRYSPTTFLWAISAPMYSCRFADLKSSEIVSMPIPALKFRIPLMTNAWSSLYSIREASNEKQICITKAQKMRWEWNSPAKFPDWLVPVGVNPVVLLGWSPLPRRLKKLKMQPGNTVLRFVEKGKDHNSTGDIWILSATSNSNFKKEILSSLDLTLSAQFHHWTFHQWTFRIICEDSSVKYIMHSYHSIWTCTFWWSSWPIRIATHIAWDISCISNSDFVLFCREIAHIFCLN